MLQSLRLGDHSGDLAVGLAHWILGISTALEPGDSISNARGGIQKVGSGEIEVGDSHILAPVRVWDEILLICICALLLCNVTHLGHPVVVDELIHEVSGTVSKNHHTSLVLSNFVFLDELEGGPERLP